MKNYNINDFQVYIRQTESLPDVVQIDNMIFTMEEYDMKGKFVYYGNRKYRKQIKVETEDRYNKGMKDAVVTIYDSLSQPNDICYVE